ncbi:hypothetical protein ACW95P_02980 [Candidatus Mycoplasma pogonae]
MTKKSKLLLLGGIVVSSLLVAAIGVTSAVIDKNNKAYNQGVAVEVNKPSLEFTKVPVNYPASVDKINKITANSATFQLKDLTAYNQVFVRSGSLRTAKVKVNNGKAEVTLNSLQADSEIEYAVVGVSANGNETTISNGKLRTPAGVYLKEINIGMNDVSLKFSGLENGFGGDFMAGFSIIYRVKNILNPEAKYARNPIQKFKGLYNANGGDNDLTIKLNNLSPNVEYEYQFVSNDRTIFAGEFKTLPLVK